MNRKLVYPAATILILCLGCTSAGQQINRIYAPVFVGRPTDNAFNGLVQMPGGERRHYGFEGPRFETTYPHQKPRWQIYAIEPTLMGMADGNIWMLLRTSMDRLYESLSWDHGASWGQPVPSRFYATRGGKAMSLDKSVQQTQAVELPHGKVLLASGQHPLVRGMIIFDPDWLCEKVRADSFAAGLANWSTHQYMEGIRGHCAYNRVPGPSLIDHPDLEGRQALRLRHLIDERLVCDVDGAVWNFPAALEGTFTTCIRLNPGGSGGRISLIDRWFNPTDTLAYRYAVFTLRFDGAGRAGNRACLPAGEWADVEFERDDLQAGSCRLSINGTPFPDSIPFHLPSVNGINYVQFQSVADVEDPEGFLIASVSAAVKNQS